MDVLHQDMVTSIGTADKLAIAIARVKRRWPIREVECNCVENAAAEKIDEVEIIEAVIAPDHALRDGCIYDRRKTVRIDGDLEDRVGAISGQLKSYRVPIEQFRRCL